MNKTTKQNPSDIIGKYVKEFENWRTELKKYWKIIDQNQDLYEFYKTVGETESSVSLNTPFAIVESMVSKVNSTSQNITVKANGENGLGELERWIGSITKNIIHDKDVAKFKGTFRKLREKFARTLFVKGNAVASVEYLYKTSIINGEKKVVADNPYVRIRDLKSLIFNPTHTLVDSDIYYIESHLKYQNLLDNEYDEKTGKGLYKNLGELKNFANEKSKVIEDEYNISGDSKIQKTVEPIHILERWEGTHYCVIADKKIIIREEEDPFKIGGHNLLLAMDYVVDSRPYGYGEIDAIYKPVMAQDTIINQSIDMVNRFLRPAVLVDPSSQIDLDELIMIIENGGVMNGNPQMIGNVPSQAPPQQAFQTVDIMQQAIERAARFSPYSAGIPAQSSDKTQGTMGGIQSIQQAAEPNFEVKIDLISESFDEPFASTALQMVANLMGENDIRYGLLQGQKPEWVKSTKGILQGKATMQDMITAGMIDEKEAQEFLTTVDPTTGQQIPIPGAEQALVFDFDWIVSVKLDNQSKADKNAETQSDKEMIDWGMKAGVNINPEKAFTMLAKKQGLEDIEEILYTPEELQQQQQAQMAQQQQQMQQQQQSQQAQMQAQQQSEQLKIKADLAKEAMKGSNAQQVAGMRHNVM